MQLRAELFVDDLDTSVRFYEDVLGFVRAAQSESQVSVRRDAVVLGLGAVAKLAQKSLDGGSDERSVRSRRGAGVEIVLELDGGANDVDALHRHCVEQAAEIVAGPTDQRWGLRDFCLLDPDGYYLRVTHTPSALLLAVTPEPPYTAVIFTSIRTEGDNGYAETSALMDDLAARQPDYLGMENAPGGLGITISYWATAADARAWRQVAEHRLAQRRGRAEWYRSYQVRVATVEREYGMTASTGDR